MAKYAANTTVSVDRSRSEVRQVLLRYRAFRAMREVTGEEYLAGWEDQEGRTQEDVLAALEQAAQRAEREP